MRRSTPRDQGHDSKGPSLGGHDLDRCKSHEPQPVMHCCHDTSQAGKGPRTDYLFWYSLVCVCIFYVLGALGPWSLEEGSWLAMASQAVLELVHTVWWGVAIGVVFIGLLSKVPHEFMISVLGTGGTLSGLLRATWAGVLLDLCSHGILMVAVQLYQKGASLGQVVAFLLASPWNSFSLTLILYSLIGLKWTLCFILMSAGIAFATGLIFDALVARNVLPANQNTVSLPDSFRFWHEVRSRINKDTFLDLALLKEMALNGVRDSRIVVRWILFGILLTAGVRASFDPSYFSEFFGPTVFGLVATLLVATILEVCSEGGVPVAAEIINRAHAPGNGFAFLMAGVSTDYTEIMILKDTTKSWKIAGFLPLITLPQILLVAWILNFFEVS